MRYDSAAQPSARLLRHETAISLCIHCHDGSRTGAPDVIAPIEYTPDPAGGAFPATWSTASGTAHLLAGDPVTPPGGTQPMTVTCTSCHDPHAGPGFRNLKLDPGGTGASLPVIASQRMASNGTNAAQVYASGNPIYRSGMSAWCGACHTQFHGRSTDAEGTASPWLRHPQDTALSQARHVDYTYWLGPVENRMRVQSPTDDDIPSADDQVFCLSCHRAHGSTNRAALIFADGSTRGSTCAQCHDK
ncbi:MAG TPA: cytochrome c3 family protein [Nonomuraea sp.]|nr:cytochrome c3 family protein [Nonomuraea sp.]